MRCGWLALGLLISVTAAPSVYAASGDSETWIQSGTATFYRSSRIFHRTSTGEIFNENALTAAHPSLPLGSIVRVTADDTGRSIVVRINDRSAESNIRRGRVIDLSYGAAKQLGIHGTGDVTLTQVTDGAASTETAAATPAPEEVAEAADDTAPAHPVHHRRRHHTETKPAN